ncbi:MAG: GtrA family protein [Bacilli bacterium]|nr:GtrA family protein [Bacilli bacterium]
MTEIVKQLLKFGIVGGIAFLIDFFVLYFCTDILNIHYLISSIISFTVSVIFNYILSVKWVFNVNNDNSKKKNFIVFIVLSIIGLLINELIMYIMVDKFKIYYMLSKIVSTIVVMIFNFITRKIILEK